MQTTTNRHTLVVRAPDRLQALVDPLRLEQVLTNLLDNAIKYSPDGGPVDVDLSLPCPGLARLVVADRGIGIPAEKRQRIFERFYQAHEDNHASGLGLGLFICRQIVERHGGSITPEFLPDGGTRFSIDLPTGLADGPTE
jgi:two-component system sensor histidine kinase KdpD